jgi:predicted RNA-binding protein YlqC (UPF0109 family)
MRRRRMNAQLSEVPAPESTDPVESVKVDFNETDVAAEIGRLGIVILKQGKVIAALQAALREAKK